jgi:hypothetical protein
MTPLQTAETTLPAFEVGAVVLLVSLLAALAWTWQLYR